MVRAYVNLRGLGVGLTGGGNALAENVSVCEPGMHHDPGCAAGSGFTVHGHPGGNPEANREFIKSTPIQMMHHDPRCHTRRTKYLFSKSEELYK